MSPWQFCFVLTALVINAALFSCLWFAMGSLKEIMEMEYTEILTLLTDIDTATNNVAAVLTAQVAIIADLQAQIAEGTPVTQEQLDALGAALTAEKDKLFVLAADPANPIPA